MNKVVIAVSIVAVMFLTGCATVNNGRFSVIDLDLRTPEQVLAQKSEKMVVYESDGTNKVAQVAGEPRAFPYELLFKLLEVVKGRLMIFSLEWKTND
jgi:hypothetical protein